MQLFFTSSAIVFAKVATIEKPVLEHLLCFAIYEAFVDGFLYVFNP